MSVKSLFVAATRQNDGKTMVSLGLFHAIMKRFPKVGYMKPVGQQYRIVDGKKIDKDAVLFQQVYDLKDKFLSMSPIAVPRGFTEAYIDAPRKEELEQKVLAAKAELIVDKDFLLIEGTGHSGVGTVFDLSNARTAKLLGAKVVLVSLGGIGRAIDEIMLNKAVFDKEGVELMGVIVNKVKEDKFEKVGHYVEAGLARLNIPVLGKIPYIPSLHRPSVDAVFEELEGEVLSSRGSLYRSIERCIIGDMVPHDILNIVTQNTLLIVPANREGLIMTALCGNLLRSDVTNAVSGIVFTGGKVPHQQVLEIIKKANIPVMTVSQDSFSVAKIITKLLVKLRPEETDKIKKVQSVVEEYVDVDRICELIK
ncbi:hypothetical protein DID80_00775 [Candidatus Marinamargulisbacteria bacterium SCGC AAA071-K20]|nr:hypothetical protein DID80_00775 [Candidatus Marinamargulisbacteria bacterium SCGC AAA071-K20]